MVVVGGSGAEVNLEEGVGVMYVGEAAGEEIEEFRETRDGKEEPALVTDGVLVTTGAGVLVTTWAGEADSVVLPFDSVIGTPDSG